MRMMFLSYFGRYLRMYQEVGASQASFQLPHSPPCSPASAPRLRLRIPAELLLKLNNSSPLVSN